MKWIDDFLNNITMYRLLLYILIVFLSLGAIFGFLGLLPFGGLDLIFSTTFLVAVCWVTNTIFARVFKAQTNLESVYITALILSLIISPIKSISHIPFLFWAGVLAMASKYIIAIHKKHIFNPAAFAVVVTSFAIGGAASWWVGTKIMFPALLIGGLLIVRKIKRADLVISFLGVATFIIAALGVVKGLNPFTTIEKVFIETPILFFAFIMLTEPLTTPPTNNLQIIYGSLVGLLFFPQLHIGPFSGTPELALITGNLFSYLVSPKETLILSLSEKLKLTPDTYSFIFDLKGKFKFRSGQYLEWTLGQKNPDARGTRRYFTIASSPTEDQIILGVKFNEPGSSYKREMLKMKKDSKIVAGQLAGDFTLPEDQNKKLVFVAGGIGVTPYRSMIKYLIDTNEKRDVIFIYSEKNKEEMVFKEIFDQGKAELGIKVIYFETETKGHITDSVFKEEIPDYKARTFYISGPHTMITAFESILGQMGVPKSQIKTDYFPGYT